MPLDLTRAQLEAVFESTRILRAISEEVASYFKRAPVATFEIDPVFDETEITGKPVRRVVTRSAKSTRGFFPSAKTGAIIPWEGENELWGLFRLDCNPAVHPPLYAQPLTASYICPWTRKPRKATPDFFYLSRQTRGLFPTLLEIKDDKTASRPEEQRRLELLEYIFERMGVEYRLWLANDIKKDHPLRNAQWLARYKKLRLEGSDKLQLQTLFQEGTSCLPLSAIARRLGERGEAKAFAMLLRNWIVYDDEVDVHDDPDAFLPQAIGAVDD